MRREINQPEIKSVSQEAFKNKFDELVEMMKSDERREFYIAEKRKIKETIENDGNIHDKGDYSEWSVKELRALIELLEQEEGKYN